MPTTAAFEEAYQRLNPEQRQAVDTLDGPVLVLAGPGTGKTQVLTLRIANLLKETDSQPHNILALSFTNAAAKNMQQRLVKMIGSAGYAVKSTTFHSFCSEVIGEHAEAFPVSPRGNDALAEVDKYALIESILRENSFEHIKPVKNPYLYVRQCLSLISSYKREGQTPLTLQALAQAEKEQLESEDMTATKRRAALKNIEKNLEVAQVYAEYEKRLRALGQYDFEDLILWVKEAFEQDEDLVAEYRERYHYVLIDEFQDTNQAQLGVIQALMAYWEEAPNLFVVGDPNQSIYRFQGASLANTLGFLDHYPDAAVITLRVGYRCGQEIYDAAAAVIANNKLEISDERLQALYEPLKNVAGANAQIVEQRAPNTLAECFWIVDKIRELEQSGVPLHEMAVLYHNHSHASLLESVLSRAGIPFEVSAKESVLHHPAVRHILTLLRFLVAVRNKEEGPLMLPLLQLPWWEFSANDVLKFLREGSTSRAHHNSPWEFWQDDGAVKRAGLEHPEAFFALRDRLIAWQHQDGTLPLPQFLEAILREAGFFRSHLQQDVPLIDLNAVASFLREAHGWYARQVTTNLAEFLDRLDRLEEHGLGIPADDLDLKLDAVSLATAHQAKGREWRHVFVLHTNDTRWGNVRPPSTITPLSGTIPYAELDKKERNEDERRLFYVALTRAKDAVYLNWSEADTSSDRSREMQASQFITEVPSELLSAAEPLAPETIRQRFQEFLHTKETDAFANVDRAWLRSLVDDFKLSVSALNEFLNCPVGFFYKRLIRIPTQPTLSLAIGNAAHAALEVAYRELNRSGSLPPEEQLMSKIEQVIVGSGLPPASVDDAILHTQTMIRSYLAAQGDQLKPSLLVERFFGGQPPVFFEGLQLSGRIDRVDLLDDVTQTVRVVDYKTGTVKTRGQILGQTATSDGSLKRQLVFYRLLGELDSTFPYQITQGQFVFLEKDTSDKYRQELFDITDEDMEQLKDVLRSVQSQLKSLEFVKSPPCQKCDTCKLLGFDGDEALWQRAAEQLGLF